MREIAHSNATLPENSRPLLPIGMRIRYVGKNPDAPPWWADYTPFLLDHRVGTITGYLSEPYDQRYGVGYFIHFDGSGIARLFCLESVIEPVD